MAERLVIIGAGGMGRQVVDIVRESGADLDVLGWLDDGEPDLDVLKSYGLPLLGPTEALADLPGVGYLLAVSDPCARRRIQRRLPVRYSPVAIHPRAVVHETAVLGAGCVIGPGAVVMDHSTLGEHVHVNINSVVGHDVVLGDFTTVSPLTTMCGGCTTGAAVYVGAGSTINPKVTVGAGAVIGSAAAVTRNVPAGVTAVGVPAHWS